MTPQHALRTAIAAAMQSRGITQTQMAARTGIPQGNLSAMLSGRRTISFDRAVRIAAAIGGQDERKALDAAIQSLFGSSTPVEAHPE